MGEGAQSLRSRMRFAWPVQCWKVDLLSNVEAVWEMRNINEAAAKDETPAPK